MHHASNLPKNSRDHRLFLCFIPYDLISWAARLRNSRHPPELPSAQKLHPTKNHASSIQNKTHRKQNAYKNECLFSIDLLFFWQFRTSRLQPTAFRHFQAKFDRLRVFHDLFRKPPGHNPLGQTPAHPWVVPMSLRHRFHWKISIFCFVKNNSGNSKLFRIQNIRNKHK